ncbi:cupin domain-containing protein [Hylemonella gracilis]|uniref:Cupin domain-containing protein n=1 Tax=Hylemonella gracilis TaxID=80880 RepID=A0A4P6UK71_9BURK|nr:cupin domain-containing protein [Hylemonella gracilis]QBK05768.1 cupin domain-containing protein [Hylemonella gracilis]
MDVNLPLTLLGGISPAAFMRRYWQKKPLLVRQAVPGMRALLTRTELFALAGQEDVESRLVTLEKRGRKESWGLRRGPFDRRALPALKPGKGEAWTLLVQGVDLHSEAAHQMMQQFRFVPDARLDDLMISYAVEGGGVGPHFDSYDVFLLQTHGKRHWKIGSQQDLKLRAGVPLKILADFRPEQDFVLEPGDMLYLPPQYAHDGVAVEGECMTCSIGFRSPKAGGLAQELLQRLAEDAAEGMDASMADALYRDPTQAAVGAPAGMPGSLLRYARQAVQQALRDPQALARALGEVLSEPKPQVWFEPASPDAAGGMTAIASGIQLDRRTRMLYDDVHLFINGESYLVSDEDGGRDAVLLRRLADERRMGAADLRKVSRPARELIAEWREAGWLHGIPG